MSVRHLVDRSILGRRFLVYRFRRRTAGAEHHRGDVAVGARSNRGTNSRRPSPQEQSGSADREHCVRLLAVQGRRAPGTGPDRAGGAGGGPAVAQPRNALARDRHRSKPPEVPDSPRHGVAVGVSGARAQGTCTWRVITSANCGKHLTISGQRTTYGRSLGLWELGMAIRLSADKWFVTCQLPNGSKRT